MRDENIENGNLEYSVIPIFPDAQARLLADMRGSDSNRQFIISNNLGPYTCIEYGDGEKYNLSHEFEIDGRRARLMYVSSDSVVGGREVRYIHPKIIYQSNSHGLWRILPEHEQSGRFTKEGAWGNEEDDLSLPIKLQKALTELDMSQRGSIISRLRRLIRRDPDLGSSIVERFSALSQSSGGFHLGIEERLQIANTDLGSGPPSDPGKIDVNDGEMAPNYNLLEDSWDADFGSLYGRGRSYVYKSYNGQLRYLINVTNSGKIWVAQIERVPPDIHPFWKVSRRPVDAGFITTMPYDYEDQIPAYIPRKYVKSGPGGKKFGPYRDISRYVFGIPIVQEARRVIAGYNKY